MSAAIDSIPHIQYVPSPWRLLLNTVDGGDGFPVIQAAYVAGI